MSHDFEYFKDFLADPTVFGNREFYEKVYQWADYVVAHKGEFDYLNGDEWQEIRERIVGELDRRADLGEEFAEFSDQIELIGELPSESRIAFFRRWLVFMTENRVAFGFTEAAIERTQSKLENLVRIHEKRLRCEEDIRIKQLNHEAMIKELDESTAEYYERTGKIPVLTALQPPKKFSGN